MTYFDIKFLHHLMTALLIYSLMMMSYNPKPKLNKFLYLFCSIMMLVSGVMSMERLDMRADDTYPVWIYAKLGCLLIATALPILMAKFLPKIASKLSFLYLIFILAAVFLGVYRP